MSTVTTNNVVSTNNHLKIYNTDIGEQFSPNVLSKRWVLWSHLPQNTDWTISGYNQIATISSLEEIVALFNVIPDTLLTSCMLFIMKEDILPIWEDAKNCRGGCFKYRIINKHVPQTWKHMAYSLLGETMSSNKKFLNNVTGIAISPKKKFCILKVWTSNCDYQNSDIIDTENVILQSNRALFEAHNSKNE